jgi:ectoine hydroxylase-related dioxygenase (phytanoyl-CoA dioxygenase family)
MLTFPEKMKKVFSDDVLQKEFEDRGYVVVNFYSDEEVVFLLNLYRELHPKDEKGFFPSTFSKNKNYRITADEEIRNVGARSMSNLLKDVNVVCGSFIVKSPGEDSIMDVHQDMTLVDESEFTGINIWCPLVDLTENNGLLYALPGSHRIFATYRGASLPTIYRDVYDSVKKYSVPLYLKAGQAIIFDQSILHWSKANLSNEVRPVTNIYFTHKDARFQICYYNESANKDKVEVFEQDETFMTDFEQFGDNIYDRPKIGKSLGFFEYDFPVLTNELLDEKYGEKRQKVENGFFQKIKSLFS